MKPTSTTIGRAVSALAIVTSTVFLLSWNHRPAHDELKESTGSRYPTMNLDRLMTDLDRYRDGDTTPLRNKKPRDIDEAIEQLDRVNIDMEIEQAMKNVKVAMDQIDEKKLRAEVDKALKSVDMEKIQKEVKESMSKIDWDEIKKNVNESMAKIDWKKIQANIDEVKNINWDEMQKEIRKAQVEIDKAGPEIKIEMQKAKVELKAFKGFIDGLEKDGLINKKDGYTLDHKDGELLINGKKASEETQKKYRSFLESHDSFHIQVKDGEFDMNNGSWNNDNDDEDSVVS